MSFLSLNSKQISKLVHISPKKNGCYNIFVRLNDQIGLKLSLSEKSRDYCYKIQTRAAKHELGPLTYGKIDGIEYDGRKYWGYFTECIEVFEGWIKKTYEERCKIKKQYELEIEILVEKLGEIGYYFEDSHCGNIGFKRFDSGIKMCAIDFDDLDDDLVDLEIPNNF